jgi:hypothetical protein
MLPSILALVLCPNPGDALALASEIRAAPPGRLVSYARGLQLSFSIRKGMVADDVEKLLGELPPFSSVGFVQDGGCKVAYFYSSHNYDRFGLSITFKSAAGSTRKNVHDLHWDGWRLLAGPGLYDLYFWWSIGPLTWTPSPVVP